MSFESPTFATFVLLVVTVFWMLTGRRVAQKAWLLVASVYFYGQFSWAFVAVLAISTGVNFSLSELIGKQHKASLTWLRVGLAFNILLLGVFKYYNFFRESLDDMLDWVGLTSHLPVLGMVLPIGISFYSFQAIAYLVELHQGGEHRAKNLLDFSLFMAYFLKLLSGPIIRAREFLPQLSEESPAQVPNVSTAAGLLLSGLFKRVILASMLSSYGVAEIMSTPDNYSASALWVAMVGYSVQLYCDFSGYTDLMRGISLLMGLKLPENFNHPYVATDVGDFWRRWHISFSNWLRDFIYFPLGGSRVIKLRTYFNLFMTMFVCGIWHGASWGFIVWGSVHGVALAAHKALLDVRRERGDDLSVVSPAREMAGWIYTFGLVCFSRIFFVTPTLSVAGTYLRRMFDPGAAGDGFDTLLIPAIAAGMAIQFVGPACYRYFVAASDRFTPARRFVFWTACGLVLLLVRPGGVSPNAYFNF